MTDIERLTQTASQVRRDIVRMVTQAGSGHPGGSLSSTDIVTALFFKIMKHSPEHWNRRGEGNDMFFLSAGHMSPLFYSVLARSGYFPVKELATFRHLGSRLQGHPSTDHGLPGVYMPSGSLGQGLSVACGAALGKKLDKDDRMVYVLVGDGESEEGQIWEAAMFAAHHKIDNLIAMTLTAEGNDMQSVLEAYGKALGIAGHGKPVMILFKTVMGKGVDFMEGTCKWHGKAPSAEQCEAALAQIKETLGDF